MGWGGQPASAEIGWLGMEDPISQNRTSGQRAHSQLPDVPPTDRKVRCSRDTRQIIGKRCATTRGLSERRLPTRAASSSRGAVQGPVTSRLAPIAARALPSQKGSFVRKGNARLCWGFWRDKLETVTEEEKRRFDAVFSLCDIAWRQFNLRRDYEFKVTLSLWTALALAVAGVARASKPLTIPMLAMVAICVTLFSLHTLWCWGIGQAQNGERRITVGYERTLQELSQTCFDEITKKQLASLRNRMGLLRNWTYVFQLGVTALLLMALLVARR